MNVFGTSHLAYKYCDKKASVYMIKSISGFIYIGMAEDIPSRMVIRQKAYESNGRKYSNSLNKRILYEIFEYGYYNLEVSVLFDSICKETAKLIEKSLIKYYSDIGINLMNSAHAKPNDLNKYFEEIERKS